MALLYENDVCPEEAKPTEEDLAERVRRFINERVPACRDFTVEHQGGTVVLQGHVPSIHNHWMCLECSQHVAGVIHVIDEIQIAAEDTETKTCHAR